MPTERYTLVTDLRGSWSVIDSSTKQPAHHRNHIMIRMGWDEADAMADLLNQLKHRRNPRVRQFAGSMTAE